MKEILKKLTAKFPKRKSTPLNGICANCTHPLTGNYCSHCGQSAKDYKVPIYSLLLESLGDSFSFDNKLFHTLWFLIARPGFLTKEFILGRRVRYTPPFRLYLFLTFFAFFLLFYNHKPDNQQSNDLSFTSKEGQKVDLLSYLDDALVGDKKMQTSLVTDSLENREFKNDFLKLDFGKAEEAGVDTLQEKVSKNGNSVIQTSDVRRVLDMWRLNPAMMLDHVFKKLSQTLLIIFPVFACFLALFYLRKKHYFLEYLLLSLNFHSFIFVLVIVSELLIMTQIEFLQLPAFYIYFLIPLQLLLSLKFYFKQSWRKTIVKFVMLSFVYNILLFAGLLFALISVVVE